MQQSYAKVSGVTEKIKVTELVEDALRMNSARLPGTTFEVVREFDHARRNHRRQTQGAADPRQPDP